MTAKTHPRLADHALARRHVARGEEFVVIHDARSGALVKLDARAWALAACADGTRDRDGIALAAARAGLYRRASEIDEVLAALEEHGLLADGVEPAAEPAAERGPGGARPLERLPGYAFRCSGRGTCCSQYATIALTPADLVRARRAGLAVLPGDEAEARVVLPARGVRPDRLAMALVDGRCLQLAPDGRCGLEARGGPAAKPAACRTYPATLVDDGEAVRVSVAPECSCVLESARESLGAPLLGGALTVADVPAGVSVRRLPPVVTLAEGVGAPVVALRSWSRAAAGSVPAAGVPERCAALAADLARGLPEGAFADRAPEASDREALRAEVAGLARAMEASARAAEQWRSEADVARRARRAVADAALRLVADAGAFDAVVAAERWPDLEGFVLRAALFGHQLAGERPLSSELRALGARFLVARALGPDVAASMATVMATTRS